MKVVMGIDVGHTTGLAIVAYFESSKKPVIYVARSYGADLLNQMQFDLFMFQNIYHPDAILVEYPVLTQHLTYRPETLRGISGIVEDMLAKTPHVAVRPTDWKQTPAAEVIFSHGQILQTRHELDAARMCVWGVLYSSISSISNRKVAFTGK